MQINSAQDYLTQKKRQIIAATFTQNPPPAKRRNNTIVTGLLANKATGYEKVPYAISLAPGTAPGPAYVFPGLRPTVNNCCIQPMASAITTPTAYNYTVNTTGTAGNTVSTYITNSSIIKSSDPNDPNSQIPSIVSDSLGKLYYYTKATGIVYTIPVGGSSMTPLATIGSCRTLNLAIDSNDFLYYQETSTGDIKKLDTKTGTITTLCSTSILQVALGGDYGTAGMIVDDVDYVYVINNFNSKLIRVSQGAAVQVAGTYTALGYPILNYNKATKIITTQSNAGNGCWRAVLSGGVLSAGFNDPTYSAPHAFTTDPTGTYRIYYDSYNIFAINASTKVSNIIAGISGTSGNADGTAASATFGMSASNYSTLTFAPNGSLYFIDLGNSSIRMIVANPVLATPAITTYYPNAGALI